MTLCYFNVETILPEVTSLWRFCSELLNVLQGNDCKSSSTYLTQSHLKGMLASKPVYNVILSCNCSQDAVTLYALVKSFNNKEVGKVELLLFGNNSIYMTDWQIPHPGLKTRAYILCPLLELNPNLIFPDGERILDKLSRLGDDEVTATKIYEVKKTLITEKVLD